MLPVPEAIYADLIRRSGRAPIRPWGALLLAAIIAALVWDTIGGPAAVSAASPRTATVAADRLNVRPTPGTDGAPVASLEKGTRVRVLRNLGDWLEIEHADITGFVRNRPAYIILESDPDTPEQPQTEKEAKIRRFETESEQIYHQLATREKTLRKEARREKETIERLHDIDLALNHSRKQVAGARRELSALGDQIAASEAVSETLAQEIDMLETAAAGRLAAYYRLTWLGKLHVLASADSVAELVQRKAAMDRILERDEAVWEALRTKHDALAKTLAALHVKRQRQRALEAELTTQLAVMNSERQARQDLLAEIRQKKDLELAAIASLQQAAEDLERILQSLRQSASGETAETEKSFIDFKGLLKMPVRGKIITKFGPYRNIQRNVVNFRSGIDIQADRGEPIRAVGNGRVLYSDWLKGYGNMIIIDHGGAYYTVYAHAEELFKRKGDPVEKGEVIATVGDSGSLIGPGLYFEVRHHGKPLDPLNWIKTG